MMNILLVGLGGFLGSITRFLLGSWIGHLSHKFPIPLSTFVINVTGSFLIGFLAGLSESRGALSSETRIFLLVGFLGGYTTFSTFSFESFELLRSGHAGWALTNIFFHVAIGVVATWFGFRLA